MMIRKDLLSNISEKTGIAQEQVEIIYYSMVHTITESLSQGEEVNLKPEWGSFIPKMWDNPALNENSQRTRKLARYKIRFRVGKELENTLRISSESHSGTVSGLEE